MSLSEFELVNQTAAGFGSMLPWVTGNSNVQRLANLSRYAVEGLSALELRTLKTFVSTLSVSTKSDSDASINPGGLLFLCHRRCFRLPLDFPALSIPTALSQLVFQAELTTDTFIWVADIYSCLRESGLV